MSNKSSFFDLNYYEVLKLNQNASFDEIKKAYFRLAKKYHPDICKDDDATEKFKYLNESYQTLKDENERAKYDEFLNNCNQEDIDYQEYSSQDSYFDVTQLDSFMKKRFVKNEFIQFLKSINNQSINY